MPRWTVREGLYSLTDFTSLPRRESRGAVHFNGKPRVVSFSSVTAVPDNKMLLFYVIIIIIIIIIIEFIL